MIAQLIALLRDRLAALSPNERRLITVAGGLALVLGLTLFVITPLRSLHEDARRDYESAARLLEDVRGGVRRAGAPGAAPAGGGGDARALVTRSALARGLAIARMSPVEGGLSLRLEAADPGQLYAWLAELDAQQKIPVRRATLRVNEADGTVQADLVLAAGTTS